MEVNCVNKNGLTPLDILMLFQSEVGDREIEEILWHAGASTRAREVQPAALPVQTSLGQNNNINTTTTPRNEPSVQGLDETRSQRLLEYFMYNERRESRSETRNTLLVIAILIVTATYQAMLSPPGGVWQDDSASRKENNGSHSTHVAGKSVMATKNKPLFVVFLLFNTIGFTFSVQLIYFLTNKFPLLWNLRISVFALSVTYVASLNAISPSSILSIFLTAMSLTMPFLFVAKMLFGKVFGGIRYSFVSGPVMYV